MFDMLDYRDKNMGDQPDQYSPGSNTGGNIEMATYQ